MRTRLFLRHVLLPVVLSAFASVAPASTSGVVISQVYGAGGNSGAVFNNDYVELFHAGSSPVDITGWSMQYASATGTGTFAGNGPVGLPPLTLQPGQYLLVRLSSGGAAGAALPAADAVGTINMSASAGKVVLVSGSVGLGCNGGSMPCDAAQRAQIVDLLGFGSANFFEGAAAPAASAGVALLRQGLGCVDTDDNASDFVTGTPAPRNSASPRAPCSGAPGNQPIAASCPAIAVPAGSGGNGMLSATDPDSIVDRAQLGSGAPAGFSLGALTPAAGDGGTANVSLWVAASVPAGTHAVPVSFGNNEGQSAVCTVTVTVGEAVRALRTYAIQGSGPTSPWAGQIVSTTGVVTRVNNNGYFVQDPAGDGDPSTSDGLFVFTGSAPVVSGGQAVQVTGRVVEFNTGASTNPATQARPVTQLAEVSAQSVLGSGHAIVPTPIVLPLAHADELERYEGMLVRIDGPMVVSQNHFLGRYGQVTLAAGARLETVTNRHRPNSPEALALAEANRRSSLVLDDGSSLQNPAPIPFIGAGNTLRAGDTVRGLTGVIDFGLSTNSNTGPADYRLHPTVSPVFTRDNPRSAVPQAVGGNVRIASFNVLNYFTTIDQAGASCFPSGTRSDCRGADSAAEFARQRTKIVEALAALDADAVGLMEMENNGGTAIQNLVDALNAKVGAGTYAAVPVPAAGTGTDAIKVAMIHKPARLARVGAPLSDTHAAHNRPPLAQTFAAANGERFTLVVNHFKSKGCDGATGADVDSGDGQGCFNAKRLQQGEALRAFLAGVQAASGDPDVLVIGDLNAYAKEDPIVAFTAAGWIDEIARFNRFGYSYVFDGAAGRLDHALATASLSPQVTGAIDWHINADEPSVLDYNLEFKPQDLYGPTPYRSADHDPVLLGLWLVKRFAGTSGRDTITGSAGDDLIAGGAGADMLSGGGGRDVFAYASLRDAADTITDFEPAIDRLDLTALLASLNRPAGSAVADGVVRLVDGALGATLQIDADGSAGPGAPRLLVTLRGVSAAQIDLKRDAGL